MYLHFMGVNLLRMRNEQYITIKVTPGGLYSKVPVTHWARKAVLFSFKMKI